MACYRLRYRFATPARSLWPVALAEALLRAGLRPVRRYALPGYICYEVEASPRNVRRIGWLIARWDQELGERGDPFGHPWTACRWLVVGPRGAYLHAARPYFDRGAGRWRVLAYREGPGEAGAMYGLGRYVVLEWRSGAWRRAKGTRR